jgi:hypothetical protein
MYYIFRCVFVFCPSFVACNINTTHNSIGCRVLLMNRKISHAPQFFYSLHLFCSVFLLRSRTFHTLRSFSFNTFCVNIVHRGGTWITSIRLLFFFLYEHILLISSFLLLYIVPLFSLLWLLLLFVFVCAVRCVEYIIYIYIHFSWIFASVYGIAATLKYSFVL